MQQGIMDAHCLRRESILKEERKSFSDNNHALEKFPQENGGESPLLEASMMELYKVLDNFIWLPFPIKVWTDDLLSSTPAWVVIIIL